MNICLGEIVLIPRTRGGFSYAKITKKFIKHHCFFQPSFEHKINIWRVVYYNSGKPLYKDLSAPYIGKLIFNKQTENNIGIYILHFLNN